LLARESSQTRTAPLVLHGRAVEGTEQKDIMEPANRLQLKAYRTVSEHIDGAPVQTFVPILVEHIVRNRMAQSRGQAASPVRS
jgi:hypothetical protein